MHLLDRDEPARQMAVSAEAAEPAPAPYGVPAAAFNRALTIGDIQDYLRIGRTQAYALVNEPTFPPRLRTGRSHRWNGLQVMAWIHRVAWRSTCVTPAAPAGRPAGPHTGLVVRHSAPTSDGQAPPTSRADSPTSPASTPTRRVINPAEVQRPGDRSG